MGMMTTPIVIRQDEFVLTLPRAPFTDLVLEMAMITPTASHIPRLVVERWSEDRIAEYGVRLRRHQHYGWRLVKLHRWLDPTNGVRWFDNTVNGEPMEDTKITRRMRLADWLDARFAVRPPGDRTATVRGCTVRGG